jgi:hypothetical protein
MTYVIAGLAVGIVAALAVVLFRSGRGQAPLPGMTPPAANVVPLQAGQESAGDVLGTHVRAQAEAYQRYDVTNELLGEVLERRKSVQTSPPKKAS